VASPFGYWRAGHGAPTPAATGRSVSRRRGEVRRWGPTPTGRSDGDGWDGELPVWIRDKDEGFAGEVALTDRWGFRIVGPGCQ
jgi:hypothetical protein